MLLTKKSVELLAPAGNWETFVAAIDAGATPCRDASTIISTLDGTCRIIRQGALSAERIQSVLSSSSALD